MTNKHETNPLYKIVSKFPKIIDFRNNLEEKKKHRKHLIIGGGGGLTTVRDACIDYIRELPFRNVLRTSCFDKDSTELEQEITDLEKEIMTSKRNSLETDSNVLSTRTSFYKKLYILDDISNMITYGTTVLKNEFTNHMTKNHLFIVTIRDVKLAEDFLQLWPDLFNMIDISPSNKKNNSGPKHYAPKSEIDEILMRYVKKHPDKHRNHILDLAMPEIEKTFRGQDMYNRNTLKTRISYVRKKSNNARIAKIKRSYSKIYKRKDDRK
ncbi:MAG: hypothetical protein ACUZ8O_04145 [Candidatus Anammoxibacter sp.]